MKEHLSGVQEIVGVSVTGLRWSTAVITRLRSPTRSSTVCARHASPPGVRLECTARCVLLHAKWVLVTTTGVSGCGVQPQRKGNAGDLINQSHWRRYRRAITGLKGTTSYDPSMACPPGHRDCPTVW
jgi:hypothetical protein